MTQETEGLTCPTCGNAVSKHKTTGRLDSRQVEEVTRHEIIMLVQCPCNNIFKAKYKYAGVQ